MFNATFNNISVLLMEDTEYTEKTTDLSQVTDNVYHHDGPVHFLRS